MNKRAKTDVILACAVVFSGAFFTAVATVGNTAALRNVQPRPAQATVFIGDDSRHGSGVLIASGRVLTAGHVVRNNRTPMVTMADGTKHEGVVLWITPPLDENERNHDLALVQVDGAVGPAVDISCARQPQGANIVVYGSPLQFKALATWGRIASPGEMPSDEIAEVVVIDATINAGNSGGGVWNDAGQLVGIVNAVALTPMPGSPGMFGGKSVTPLGLITPSTVICRLLGR